MSKEINNFADILDSRDIIERIEELEGEQSDLLDGMTCPEDLPEEEREAFQAWEDENGEELDDLRKLAEQGEDSPDWEYGETLIRDSYFQGYAEELADDIGAIDRNAKWPLTCIDWERASRELQSDYFSVDFAGVTYWIRA